MVARSARVVGMASISLGLLLVAVSALLVWKIVPSGQANRAVAAGFVVGLGLAVKGGVELATNTRFRDLGKRQVEVLKWLGFFALAGIAVTIVLLTT